MNITEIEIAVKGAVKEAIAEEKAAFYVEPEKHYNHHLFVDRLVKLFKGASDWAGRIIIGAIVSAILTLIMLGFIAWGRITFKGP